MLDMTHTEKTKKLVGPPKGEDYCDVIPGSEDSGLNHCEEQDKVDREAAQFDAIVVTAEDRIIHTGTAKQGGRNNGPIQYPNEAPDVIMPRKSGS